MKENKPNEVFDASFRIIGDGLNPEEINSLLGIKADHSHKKGEPNNKTGKGGKIIVGHPHKTGVWSIASELPETSSLEEHITALLDRLEPAGDKIRQLAKSYRADIYCAYFLEHGFQGGFDIKPEIMERMSRMGIILGISVYEM